MTTLTCTITKNGRSDEFGRPLTQGQSYTGAFDFVRALYMAGYCSVSDDSVFDDDQWPNETAPGNVTAVQNPATGGINLLVSKERIPVGVAATPTRTNRVVKQFTDLLGVTISTNNATVVATIDSNSPFGCPALKLVCTFTAVGGRVEVTPPALNIPAFNGHVAYSIWSDDATKTSQFSTFIGTTGYAKYQQANLGTSSSGDMVAGHRVIVGGPMRKTSIFDGGFVFGSDALQATKLRITGPSPLCGTATVWVKDCTIPAPQRPLISFTWDDGYDSWVTKVLPILSLHGIKATFAINTDQIDKGASGITTENVQTLIATGHHLACHNIYNYRLQVLLGSALGEQNGTGTSSDASGYVADYHTARATLEALGADPAGFMYHPWVQGGMDQAGAEAIYSAGCDIIRTTAPYEAQVYGIEQGNNALAIRSVNLDSSRTLSQAKAEIDSAIAYGGLVMFMGHKTDSIADSVTWVESDLAELIAYAASKSVDADILTARGVRDRFLCLGLLKQRNSLNNPPPVRCIGRLISANMNSTADQAIALNPGQWKIEGVYATKPSVSLTTAAGGVYTATAKGGTAIVAAGQAYSTLVAATDVLGATMAATPTVTGNIYLSLTTGQGAAATADVFVFGRPA